MKKTLVTLLALVFVLGIAGTALAAPANPFVDVPAKHWAYGAVAKLAKAGVVDGYGDGTFRGDKTMTRYEMAQIVAKAMAKSEKADAETKALIDKLAVEFAAELNNLGVRVAKLEKSASNIKIEGETRIRYNWDNVKDTSTGLTAIQAADVDGSRAFDWRQRLHLNAQVSPDIKYTARLEVTGRAGEAGTDVAFNRNFFTMTNMLGLDQIVLGKFGLYAGNWLAVGKTSNNDGFQIKTKLGEIDFQGFWTSQEKDVDFKGAYLSKTWSDLEINAGYLAADPTALGAPASKAFDLGLWYAVAPGWNLVGEYVSNDPDAAGVADGSAFAVQLSYTTGKSLTKKFFSTQNIVDPAKAHEQGFAVSYRSVETNGLPGKGQYGQFGLNASNFGTWTTDNVKGYWLGYQNVMQKNVLLNIEYQSLKDKTTGLDKGDFATAYVQYWF